MSGKHCAFQTENAIQKNSAQSQNDNPILNFRTERVKIRITSSMPRGWLTTGDMALYGIDLASLAGAKIGVRYKLVPLTITHHRACQTLDESSRFAAHSDQEPLAEWLREDVSQLKQ